MFRKINKTAVLNRDPFVSSLVEFKLGADFNLKDIVVKKQNTCEVKSVNIHGNLFHGCILNL